ncbi:TetR family transcriptional regulator [Brevibacterium album]|uniref:TetR family transcriptional regulator n=1 Tax=Brevibacterium album TaxID=417948 RepID=UPI0004099F8B
MHIPQRADAHAPSARTSAREKLLDAAMSLFYSGGITSTGIDAIIARAGVAKKSLYNNFASKDELAASYLRARHEEWLGLHAARSAHADGPVGQVLAVFDAYLDHAQLAYENGFRGCGLLNAAAELPAGSPGRRAVREHKEEVEQILLRALRALDRIDAEELAEHFSFLLEGAMSRAGLEGTPARLDRARAIAAGMLGTAGDDPSATAGPGTADAHTTAGVPTPAKAHAETHGESMRA